MKKLFFLTVLLLAASHARAQGCSQCRDSVAQTPAAVRAAYRQAIGMMAGGAVALFTGVFLVARRFR
ncbi:MAG: copper resistance protein CopC [Acidobacteria bacterium]|nr:copper resistance protein CopC [Acidobacteriota bacterium]